MSFTLWVIILAPLTIVSVILYFLLFDEGIREEQRRLREEHKARVDKLWAAKRKKRSLG